MSPVVAPLLLVEDDANDVLLIRRAFEKAHIANPLDVVIDGEAAVAHLAAAADGTHRLPLLVLLDLKLPRRSGLDVLQWLRADERLRAVPVVVLTGSRDSADLARAYELGANSYLVKPVNFDALLRLVSTLDLYWTISSGPPAAEGRVPAS